MNDLVARTQPDALKAVRMLWDVPWLASLRSVVRREGRGMVIPANYLLTDERRNAMAAAARSLTSLLSAAPASEDELAAEVYRLLAGFPSRTGEAEMSVQLRAEAYVDGLEGMPLWAIRDARKRVMRGGIKGATAFAPSPPEFAVAVRETVVDVEKMRDGLGHMAQWAPRELPPPPPVETAEDRARIEKRWADLQQAMRLRKMEVPRTNRIGGKHV